MWVFENSVLRRIFGLKWEVVAEGWRRLDNKELQSLSPSPNIIRVIQSRRMRWTGHVARMAEMCTRFLSENLKGRGITIISRDKSHIS
jgi:transcription elongation factor